ncbi:fluoride efflux transporter CrcB [Hamadaea sp. NPDC051192]|uniref:fluoride efflux transporter CrcB n=1 Tax=Hamadaea sp. NPDC051192 TaxID=3154940 RepID=UPI003415368F
MTVLLVALGAAFGAPSRYLLDRFVQARHDSVFPWGTFAVNVIGSFLLGSFAALSTQYFALLGTGFCGALTTYSTFGYETVRLARTGSSLYALLNVILSIIAGLLAGWAGLALFS